MPDVPDPRPPSVDDGTGKGDVGVLLVHGIGDHREADTLLGFAEPLVDWMREWLEGGGQPPRGRCQVLEARLRALRDAPESPAYALVALDDRSGRREHWLFAESWWGDSVMAPPPLRLLAWMFTRLPLIVLWHFFGVRAAVPPDARGWNTPVPEPLARAAKMVIAPPLIVAMQLLLLLAAVLLLVPFGPWRNGVLAVVRALTLTLGDSYVLLEQELQRAALVERVRRSLRWLQARAARVVVVAHSQGGAIAHEALQSAQGVDLFVSVGSGLEKLEFLRLVRERRAGTGAAVVAVAALAVGVAGLLVGAFDTAPLGQGWWVGPAFSLLVAWGAAARLAACLEPYRQALQARLAQSALVHGQGGVARWVDAYATLDLVPMGRASLLPAADHLERVELRNECSLVADHVQYFGTRAGFAARCWREMAALSALSLIGRDEHAAIERAGRWHARHAFARGFGSGLLPLSLVFGMLFFTDTMAALGATLAQALRDAELGWAERLLASATQWLSRAFGLLPGLGNEEAEVRRRGLVLGAMLLGALALAGWTTAVTRAWRAASRARWRWFCRQPPAEPGAAMAVGSAIIVLGWCLLAMAPLPALVWQALAPETLTLAAVGRAIARAGAVLLLLFAALAALAAPWLPADVETGVMKRSPHPMWPPMAAVTTALYLALAGELWRLATGLRLGPPWWMALLGGCGLVWAVALTRRPRLPALALAGLWAAPVLAAALAWAAAADAAVAVITAAALQCLLAGWLRARAAAPG